MANPSNAASRQLTPKQALSTMRLIWGALLLGLVVFIAIMVYLTVTGAARSTGDPTIKTVLPAIAAGMLVVLAPVGFVVRATVFKRGRKDSVVPPQVYLTGNIIFWAMMEAPAFLAGISILVTNDLMPSLIIALVAILLFLLSFPTGRPMLPRDAAFAPAETL